MSDTTFYTYNGKELATIRSTAGPKEEYRYIWNNGDIESRSLKDSSVVYIYYHDTSKRTSIDFQPEPDDLIANGKAHHYTKHLLTHVKETLTDLYLYYEFDSLGRIT